MHEHLVELYPDGYVPDQWFKFVDAGHERWCQTDGLIIDPAFGGICIVEIKYQHTADAWFQLNDLYVPVVRSAFGPEWKITTCEVVKWFDPQTACPTKPRLCREPLLAKENDFGVYIWKPTGR